MVGPMGSAWDDPIDDSMYDADEVEGGSWAPGPYGPDDRNGTYNEITPLKAAAALAMLDLTKPIRTFNLSETLFNGFPAFGTRSYEQKLAVSGYLPPAPFNGEILRDRPWGVNRMTHHEERVQTTYNIGSKINGLHHSGVGQMFYNGRRGSDFARDHGTAEFDTPTWGPPIVTRGLLIDVLAYKLVEGVDVSETPDGEAILRDNYRITVEDLQAAIARQQLPSFEPGDVLLVRTGWNRLIRSDPKRYTTYSPGPFMREVRWLASNKPAILGVDSWVFGCIDPAVMGRTITPTLPLVLVRYGIRAGEGLRLEDIGEAKVDRFVFCHAPLLAEGATSSSSPAMAIAN
jgi:kynurenine formamidase